MAGHEDNFQGLPMNDIRKRTLSRVQDMFSGILPQNVVQKTLSDADWNFEKALPVLHMLVQMNYRYNFLESGKQDMKKPESVHNQKSQTKIKGKDQQKGNNQNKPKSSTMEAQQGFRRNKQVDNQSKPKSSNSQPSQGFRRNKGSHSSNIDPNNELGDDIGSRNEETVNFQSHNNNGAIPKVIKKQKAPLFTCNSKSELERNNLIKFYNIIRKVDKTEDRISNYINLNIKVLIIMRGYPGSGKSTYAKQILSKHKGINPNMHIFCADDYFICKKTRNYIFNPDNLPKAHEWIQMIVKDAIRKGWSPIIVDNTNTRSWEMKPYVSMAVDHGYVIETLEPPGINANAGILAKRNVHGVPRAVINKMIERYEGNISGDCLITMFDLKYNINQEPPQCRTIKRPESKIVKKDNSKTRNIQSTHADHIDFSNKPSAVDNVIGYSNEESAAQNTNLSQNILDLLGIDFSAINTDSTVKDEAYEYINEPKTAFDSISRSFTADEQDTAIGRICTNNINEYVVINGDNTVMFQKCHENNEGVITLEEFQNMSNTKVPSDSVNESTSFDDLLDEGMKNSLKQEVTSQNSYYDILCNWDSYEDKKIADIIVGNGPKEQRQLFNYERKNEDRTFELKDASTNTNCNDFLILSQILAGIPNFTEKIIVGKPTFVGPKQGVYPRRSVFQLDRGTMTMDIETNRIEQLGSGVHRLTLMFPKISPDNLTELFEKCGKDLDWTVGILLDSGESISEEYIASEMGNEAAAGFTSTDTSENETGVTTLGEDVENESDSEREDECNNLRQLKKSDKLEDIIKHMESSFIINEECYSERIRKVRKARYDVPGNDLESDTMKMEDICITEDDAIIQENSVQETEEDISLSISKSLIMSLQNRFGGLIPSSVIGEDVRVDLPISLARQFYSYVMDSVLQQVENQEMSCNEDEMLAMQLQEEEFSFCEMTTTPNLREIMDNELALSIHKSQMKDSNSSGSETIAGRLSKQLLRERFSTMDPNTLSNLFEDTNRSLHQTMALLQAAGHKPNPREPNLLNEVDECQFLTQEEVIYQANAYKDMAKQLYDLRQDCFNKASMAFRNGNKEAASYYAEMARWHKDQINVANLLATNKLLSAQSQSRGHASANTIDLHYLNVSEALQILDLFLDAHVRNLMSSSVPSFKRSLYIITGQGIHSINGKPKIRPAVQSRLAKRNIIYDAENPGMLTAFVTKRTTLSCSE